MPDRPEGDHRRTRFTIPLVLVALLLVALPATAAGKQSRPTVSGFASSPATFAAGAKRTSTQAVRATTIRFALSERSTVSISIARRLAGRRTGKGCVKPSPRLAKRRACVRYLKTGRIVRPGLSAGAHTLGFSGRLGGRALHTGTYRATITAIDRAHHRSRRKTARFTIGRRQQGASGTPQPVSGVPSPLGPQRRNIRPCSVTLPNVAALQSTVSAAPAGSVVCLAPGTYGKLALTGHPASEVVVQPAGIATIAGASLTGSHLTLEGFNVTDEVDVQPGSDHTTVRFNQISGGYMGVNMPTDDTSISDLAIVGNKFVGPFGEDAIRANRYHDSDGDGIGLLVEGNEITGVRENGNHSDCLQSVWGGDHLVYRRNYLHDNRCQGFFIKDQPANIDGVVADDNLMLRDAAPCAQAGCGQPSIFQLFGPISNFVMTRNTIWTPEGESPTTLRNSGWGPVSVANNVVYRFWSDTSAPFASYTASNNLAAKREASWPATGITLGTPHFANPAVDDYRTNDGRGVDWAPADQHFGP